jgi:hypothetical protein
MTNRIHVSEAQKDVPRFAAMAVEGSYYVIVVGDEVAQVSEEALADGEPPPPPAAA